MPIDQTPAWENFVSEDKLTSDNYLIQGESGILAVVWDTKIPINGNFIVT